MKSNIIQLVAPTAITASMATYATADSKKTPMITKVSVSNTGAAADFSCEIEGVEVVSPFTIDENETITIWQIEGQKLAGGDTLAFKGNTDMSVMVTAIEFY